MNMLTLYPKRGEKKVASPISIKGHTPHNNVSTPGYLVMRMAPALGSPVIKQLKWFESNTQHVLDMTLDPLGEWLACACLDSSLCLLPVLNFTKKVSLRLVHDVGKTLPISLPPLLSPLAFLPLLLSSCFLTTPPRLLQNHQQQNLFGALDDITIIRPQNKKAPPTCILWWETMDDRHICITGSEIGEITFFEMSSGEELTTVIVTGCVDHLLLAHQPDHSTHLLVRTSAP